MLPDDKIVQNISHVTRANETKGCRFVRRMSEPEIEPSELGELLRASIAKAVGQIPNVAMDPATARDEFRKMHERAAIDFLAKIGK